MQTNPANLTAAQLRNFALVTGAMFAAVFGLFLPWLFGLAWPTWPWVLCLILVSWGLAHPPSLRPVYTVWMKLATALGRVNNVIILSLVFFVLIVPFGAMRRLFGKDPMARHTDRGADSYRNVKQQRPPQSLERPY